MITDCTWIQISVGTVDVVWLVNLRPGNTELWKSLQQSLTFSYIFCSFFSKRAILHFLVFPFVPFRAFMRMLKGWNFAKPENLPHCLLLLYEAVEGTSKCCWIKNQHKGLHLLPSSEDVQTQWVNYMFDGNVPIATGKVLCVCASYFTSDSFLNKGQYKAKSWSHDIWPQPHRTEELCGLSLFLKVTHVPITTGKLECVSAGNTDTWLVHE